MAFEKKEGQGSLFHNEQMTDRHPVFKGYVVYRGEEIQLALWAGKEGSKVAYSVKAEAKRGRNEEAQPAPKLDSISQRAQAAIRRPDPISSGTGGAPGYLRKEDMDDDIPFAPEVR